METKSKYISIAVAAVAIAGISIGGYAAFYFMTGSYKTPLKVFHAGSLTVPLEDVEEKFEAAYPGVDVQLQAAGSVTCVNWITDVGKVADVLATADWTLIRDMDSTYQNYTVQFATNKMVLCYYGALPTGDEDINATNFWTKLNNTAREWGFSNPNLDPCGYRTLMVFQLAEIEYSDANILDDIVLDHTDITVVDDGTNYNITCPENLNPIDNVNIRDKSVDLVTLLQEGSLDYAFEYLSVAIQHGLNYIELEAPVALNDSSLDSDYGKVKVIKCDDSISTGKSITYGVTVPLNADNPDLGAKFVEYMINSIGDAIFTNQGQPPINPCPTYNYGSWIPDNIRTYCVSL